MENNTLNISRQSKYLYKKKKDNCLKSENRRRLASKKYIYNINQLITWPEMILYDFSMLSQFYKFFFLQTKVLFRYYISVFLISSFNFSFEPNVMSEKSAYFYCIQLNLIS